MKRLPSVLCILLALPLCAAPAERLPVGEFTAPRLDSAPTIDGQIGPGEWDRALTTAGLIAPFDWQLQTAVTEMSLGWDASRFYFLFRCVRAAGEGRLQKAARENDDYNFGDPSVEIWVTPPTLVPETYQSIVNTYPAVFDMKTVPSRGYTAQGWKGAWQVAARETPDEYVIEASVPTRDFGCERVKAGDVWRFLLCRTAQGARPRSQASWSITQAFSEIPQHPPVHFADDEVSVALRDVTSVFSGRYRFPIMLRAPRQAAAKVALELRWQTGKQPAESDAVERREVDLAADARQEVVFAGDVTERKKGFFTLTVRRADRPATSAPLLRQSFPFEVNGWTPAPPAAPPAAQVEPLAIDAQFGPETRTVLVRADIFDLPGREQAASASVRLLDAASGRPIREQTLLPWRHCYAVASVPLGSYPVPLADFRQADRVRAERAKVQADNVARAAKGQPPLPIPEVPVVAPKPIRVEVTVKDAAGRPLASATKELGLLAYSAEWMNNEVGRSEQVIAPWTPVAWRDGVCGVWNRQLTLDGLGLARQLVNGGTRQSASMRLVAVADGQETTLAATPAQLARQVANEVQLTGGASAGDLTVSARTNVEFDGLVRNEWTLAPRAGQAAKLDRLELRITLPASEATHFCTTAGGWAAVHDELPDRWTSQTTASGMLVGDWVPYIWLTNSDRAFLWFADTDRGWVHEPDKALPTQEIVRAGGQVTLTVRFVETPTTLTAPRTLVWGWQAFPSRPLPAGWRAIFCGQRPPVPHTTSTYFWAEADWAVLWPYYCSPYPWHMDKSREILSRVPVDSSYHPCVGSIAHSIGRYRDYRDNSFPALAVDWGATPGQIGNSDVTASRGPNDFRLWHYQQWVREARFRGLYVDENYLSLEENHLTGNAYYLPDGRLQRAYNYLGLRDYFRRLKVMFAQNQVGTPNLWQHITSGAAYHAWFGDVFYEGENVEPTDLTFDYLEVLPASRLRAIGSSVCAGGVMTMMAQASRHPTVHAAKHLHQFVGWLLAHDVMPEAQGTHYAWLCEVARLYEPDVRFRPYWKPDTPARTSTKDCLVSLHSASDRHLASVVNTSRADQTVDVALDWRALGLEPRRDRALDAETGEPLVFTRGGFSVPVAARDCRLVLLVRRDVLLGDETFVAGCEQGPRADQALGSDALRTAGADSRPPALTAGRDGGLAVAVGEGVQLFSFLNVAPEGGTLTFDGLLASGLRADGARDSLLTFGRGLTVTLRAGKTAELVYQSGSGKDARQATATVPGPGWHRFGLAWRGGGATFVVDGQAVAELPCADLGLAPPGLKYEAIAPVVFGRALAAIDNLRCTRRP